VFEFETVESVLDPDGAPWIVGAGARLYFDVRIDRSAMFSLKSVTMANIGRLEADAASSGDDSLTLDATEEWAKHPVSVLWGQWKGTSKKEKATFDFEPHRDGFSSYIKELVAEPHCLDVFVTGRERKCTCMHDLNLEDGNELERVVSALMKFSTKLKLDRNYIMAEWIRYADAHQAKGAGLKAYLLPGGNHMICQHALARVCGMKSYAWRGLCKKVRAGKSLEHGLSGKASNNRVDFAREWLDEFLGKVEEQGAPRATRLV
jgi:hypothetical protein